jgi:hypothetical protein
LYSNDANTQVLFIGAETYKNTSPIIKHETSIQKLSLLSAGIIATPSALHSIKISKIATKFSY